MIKGIQTNLRAIEFEDAAALYRWFNEPAVMDGWGSGAAVVSRPAVTRQIAEWSERETDLGRPVAFLVEALDERPIGLLLALPEDREGRVVRLSLLIGDPQDWGKGYAGDALDAFLEAAFNGWNLHRVWLDVEAGNERALRLYRSAGFLDEGTMREARFRDGERRDLHLMGVTAHEWRDQLSSQPGSLRAQDPDEPFDIMTSQGVPTGRSKPRWQVHRDGDWHRSIHVWICGIEDGVPFLDVQRRGLEKDTWPGRLDATVAGHLRAGEDIEAALREVEEEVGLVLTMQELVHAGTHVSVSEAPGTWLDREFQEVLLARIDQPLTVYHPHPDEVDAVVRIPLEEVLALLDDGRPEASARLLAVGSEHVTQLTVVASDFIPTVDRYQLRVAVAARDLLRGERPVVV